MKLQAQKRFIEEKERNEQSTLENLQKKELKLQQSLKSVAVELQIDERCAFEHIDEDWKQQISKDEDGCKKHLNREKYSLAAKSEELQEFQKKVNVKAVEQNIELQKNLVNTNKQLEEISNKISQLTEKKEKLEQTRYEKFHNACKKINDSLSTIFKDLNPQSNCYLSYPEVLI